MQVVIRTPNVLQYAQGVRRIGAWRAGIAVAELVGRETELLRLGDGPRINVAGSKSWSPPRAIPAARWFQRMKSYEVSTYPSRRGGATGRARLTTREQTAAEALLSRGISEIVGRKDRLGSASAGMITTMPSQSLQLYLRRSSSTGISPQLFEQGNQDCSVVPIHP